MSLQDFAYKTQGGDKFQTFCCLQSNFQRQRNTIFERPAALFSHQRNFHLYCYTSLTNQVEVAELSTRGASLYYPITRRTLCFTIISSVISAERHYFSTHFRNFVPTRWWIKTGNGKGMVPATLSCQMKRTFTVTFSGIRFSRFFFYDLIIELACSQRASSSYFIKRRAII